MDKKPTHPHTHPHIHIHTHTHMTENWPREWTTCRAIFRTLLISLEGLEQDKQEKLNPCLVVAFAISFLSLWAPAQCQNSVLAKKDQKKKKTNSHKPYQIFTETFAVWQKQRTKNNSLLLQPDSCGTAWAGGLNRRTLLLFADISLASRFKQHNTSMQHPTAHINNLRRCSHSQLFCKNIKTSSVFVMNLS